MSCILSQELRTFAKKFELFFSEQPNRNENFIRSKRVAKITSDLYIQKRLYQNEELNHDLLILAAELYNMGAINPLPAFLPHVDTAQSPRNRSVEIISRYLEENNIEETVDWSILKEVVYFYGFWSIWEYSASPIAIPYLDIITKAIDLENDCTGCFNFDVELLRESERYLSGKYEFDQRDCSHELLEYMACGQRFNPKTLCTTFAEFIVFRATQAINACIRHGGIAKELMCHVSCRINEGNEESKFLNMIDGYCRLFKSYMHQDDAEEACKILCAMCK